MDCLKTLVAARARFSDFEYFGFGFIEQLARFAARWIVGASGDFCTDFRQLAHDGTFAHDLGVATDIRRAGRVVRQHADVGQTANSFELGVAF